MIINIQRLLFILMMFICLFHEMTDARRRHEKTYKSHRKHANRHERFG